MRRRLRLLALYGSFVLAFVGGVVFIGGLVIEFFDAPGRLESGGLSPAVLVALGGLCLASLMFLIWFTLVGLMVARRSREQGSGYNEAYRLIETFRFRDAIPLLERSIREGKETSEVLMLLTSAYAYSGQLAKAQAAADRAIQLYPQDPDSYLTLANGYRLQAAYDEAVNALRQAAVLAPEQPVIQAELGFMERLAGDDEAAVRSFERAAVHPMPASYCVRVFYHLAQAYQASGDTRRAVKATARMMSARAGLETWKLSLAALEGTAYGQAMRYEIEAIEQAIRDADAGNLG